MVPAQSGCFNSGMKGHCGPRSTSSRWMDGWLGKGGGRKEEGSALAPWNVASPCKLFSLCFNYCVAASEHFECLMEENTRHSFSDVNEPRRPTRSRFTSPLYSLHRQWHKYYYNVLKIVSCITSTRLFVFKSLSNLDQFQDQLSLNIVLVYGWGRLGSCVLFLSSCN